MKINNDNNKFYRFYLTGFFVILALPLLAVPPLFHPPEWAKAIVFKIVFSVILAFFLWRITKSSDFFEQLKQKYISQKKLLWLLGIILLLAFLATLFSSDVLLSLWTSPHRSGGFVFFSFCILLSFALFLITEQKDWKKLWDFSFIIGDIAVIFGAVQYFNVFPNLLVPYGRPVSTLSNSILFAAYLVLLIFMALSSAIETCRPTGRENSRKRFFYIASSLLFIFGILISGSRAAWIGIIAGTFYFLFFYPVRKEEGSSQGILKRMPLLKLVSIVLIIFAALSVYYLNSQFYIPKFLEKNAIFQGIQNRVSINLLLADPRFSAWQVALNAIKEKPIFGWGPENQSIGFDKYYDPSLPYLTKEWGSWWDRAHNIFLDLALQYGILFLAAYFFFFGYLFWRLHKTKRKTEYKETLISAHGLQTTFLAYFTTLFFGFDSVSTYIILFFLVGYCLHLTCQNNINENQHKSAEIRINPRFRKFMVLAFFFVLIIFLWQYNLKPLFINAQINKAENMACAKKLPALEKAFSQKSFLDSYLRLFYVEETKKCLEENSLTSINYMQKGIEALKYVSKVRPLYTRTWILLGSFKTILFANETNPEAKQNLFKEANSDFERALSLGPKHQETLAEWAKLYFAAEDYAKMKELSEKCVSLNPDTNTCYWYLGLAEIALSDKEKGEEHLKTAREKRFPYETGAAYSQLAIVYTKTQNYQKLVSVYESLMSLDPKNIQYYATLAAVYKEMGNYKMAKETALKILDIAPEAKDEVNEFLKTLP